MSKFEIPPWLTIDDESNIDVIDGVPFWEWSNMSIEWRQLHGLPIHSTAVAPTLSELIELKEVKKEPQKKKHHSRAGRPLKYGNILSALDPEALYSSASIARFAEEHNLLSPYENEDELNLKKQRIRITMCRFSTNHKFPIEGDGKVYIKQQRPCTGWYGWRWQQAAQIKTETS